PDYFAARRVEARRSVAAEMDVHPAELDHRRRRSVAVQRIAERFGIVAVKELLRQPNLAVVEIDADGIEIVAIGGRGREPNLLVEHDRRGPAATRNRGLPPPSLRHAP